MSAKATRRRFTAAYKLSIVEQADACRTPGEIGELLRREELYSSHLSSWRKAAREGSLRGLAKKRGPRPSDGKREARKVRKLERENARLREELRKARLIIFSRYATGWMVAERETAGLAGHLVGETCLKHGVRPRVLTPHSDSEYVRAGSLRWFEAPADASRFSGPGRPWMA